MDLRQRIRFVAAICSGGVLGALIVVTGAGAQTSASGSVTMEVYNPPPSQSPTVERIRQRIYGHRYGFGQSGRPVSTGYTPRHERVAAQPETVPPGSPEPEPEQQPSAHVPPDPQQGPPVVHETPIGPKGRFFAGPGGKGCGCDGCGSSCGDSCGGIDVCCEGGQCTQYCLLPMPQFRRENLTLRVGVQGFRGPLNGQGGSFGFHEGFNYSSRIRIFNRWCIGGQIGVNITQSTLSGGNDGTMDTDGSRDQLFLTAGLFRRTECGLQWGLAYDYLDDDWIDEVDVGQLRGEVSWVQRNTHEWGFLFATNVRTDETPNNVNGNRNYEFDTSDYYAFFYRRRMKDIRNGEKRFFLGWTDDNDGILGADLHIPVSDRWAVEGGFTYLIPDEENGSVAATQEQWNVGLSLVYYPGCNARAFNPFRPLFNVADNGSLLVRRQSP